MTTAFLKILLLALSFAFAIASQNPCHDKKGSNGAGVTCEKVRLPPKLCGACKLKPPGPGGNFVNCKAIYDLDDPACKLQLENYARMNRHCDPVRSRQVENFSNPANKMGLDYFVYSVCEECCDCIPIGAKVSEYENRKKNKTLLSSRRGNCPAHAAYDICLIWPNVKFVSGAQSKDQFWRPKICPLLKSWLNSPQSNGWLQKNFVPMDKRILEFLNRFSRVARCGNRDTWMRCHGLEEAQKRV